MRRVRRAADHRLQRIEEGVAGLGKTTDLVACANRHAQSQVAAGGRQSRQGRLQAQQRLADQMADEQKEHSDQRQDARCVPPIIHRVTVCARRWNFSR